MSPPLNLPGRSSRLADLAALRSSLTPSLEGEVTLTVALEPHATTLNLALDWGPSALSRRAAGPSSRARRNSSRGGGNLEMGRTIKR